MNEVDATARRQLNNGPGADMFAHSARVATFNRLMGLSVAAAYRDPMPVMKAKKEIEIPQDTSMFKAEG